ncbi:HPr family phosphocarrier protein [Paludifilum halophilum]|uniref:HPr domain-containing protein n=1 Tax=Paludifilum halophilum TaxID=1642702 RepID=A0A235B3W9_9BACL|nr:HPr family phosphocarrier protein [Paludifilum halophilum]OYD06984.1 hypothetical protein CHM34_13695 [Paludifilum halophilum]
MNKKKIVGLIIFLVFSLLLASIPSVSADGPSTAGKEAFVIRADRIESKGVLPGISVGKDGLLLKLQITEAKISGMTLGGSYRRGEGGGRWHMAGQDPGPVTMKGMTVEASAIGFKIKPGDIIGFDRPMKIGWQTPSIVLHDVFLRVERLQAESSRMTALDLDTTKAVSLKPPENGLYIDLRPFSTRDQTEAEEEVNRKLKELFNQEEESKESPQDDSEESSKEDKDSSEETKPGEKPDQKDPGGGSETPDEEPSPPDDGNVPSDPVPEEGDDRVKQTIRLKRYFPALEIAEKAKEYEAEVVLKQGEKEFHAKRWTELILMRRLKGTRIEIRARGPDADQAVQELAKQLGEE